MQVVCSSSTVPPGWVTPSYRGTSGSRVAASTGSTRRSRDGRTSCSQWTTASASSRWNVQVSCHITAGRVGLQVEAGDDPGEPGPAPRAAQ